MSSNGCQTQHTHQLKKSFEEMRACLVCHKRSRKPETFTVPSDIRPIGQREHFVKGTRALSETDRELQERITEKALYRDKLEKALAELQRSISPEPHPLLAKRSKVWVPRLQHETTSRTNALGTSTLPLDSGADELIETFGMMTINDGKRQFHGVTATSEYLIKENTESSREPDPSENRAKCFSRPLQLLPELVLANVQFPCPPTDQAPLDMNVFLSYLPQHDSAATLVQNYLSYFGWCAMPVPKTDLQQIFDSIYPNGAKTTTLCTSDAHGLAVLFMVFLLGTLYDIDLDLKEFSVRTEEFHSLARAAMTTDPVTEHTTVQGIQAIVLMIWYLRMFPGQRSWSYHWMLSGFLNKLVQSIGLHRDSSKCIPDPDERRRYEQTFWEFNCVDIWQSYMLGRPTSMTSSMVDCRVPTTVIVTPGHDPNFFVWKYSFTRLVWDVVGRISGTTTSFVVGQTFAAPVAYTDVIKYDKLFTEHHIPSSLAWPEHDEPLPTNEGAMKMFQRLFVNIWTQLAIMYLHRQYFWAAIQQHAYNPSQSPYARSVIAVFHSAVSVVHGMRRSWRAHPRLIERMCPVWSHCMSAALVLAALVTKSPGCQFAETALLSFDATCQMFEDAKDSLQPPNARSAMLKLRRKAHEAFSRFHDITDQLSVSNNTKTAATGSASPSEDSRHACADAESDAPDASAVATGPESEGVSMSPADAPLPHPSAQIQTPSPCQECPGTCHVHAGYAPLDSTQWHKSAARCKTPGEAKGMRPTGNNETEVHVHSD